MGLNITATVKQPEQPKYEKPSFLIDVGVGIDDVASGIKQGILYLTDSVTGGNEYEKFTKEKADEKALYEKARQESGAGINFGRFVGQTLLLCQPQHLPKAIKASMPPRKLVEWRKLRSSQVKMRYRVQQLAE